MRLKFAAASVDQKDERKPIILLITDQRLPTEKWKSEFDMMLDHSKWSGVVFFFDKEGQAFRIAARERGKPFEAKSLVRRYCFRGRLSIPIRSEGRKGITLSVPRAAAINKGVPISEMAATMSAASNPVEAKTTHGWQGELYYSFPPLPEASRHRTYLVVCTTPTQRSCC